MKYVVRSGDLNDLPDFLKIWTIVGIGVSVFICWLLIQSVLILPYYTYQWIAGELGWANATPGWWALVHQHQQPIWAITSFMVMFIVGIGVFISIAHAIFDWFSHRTQKRMSYFRNEYPAAYGSLMNTIGSTMANLFIIWVAAHLFIIIIYLIDSFVDFRSPTWAFTILVVMVQTCIYLILLYRARKIGRWAFQQVRAFIIIYIFVATPFFVAFLFTYLFLHEIFYAYLAFTETEFPPGSRSVAEYYLEHKSWFNFDWNFLDLLRTLIASISVMILCIWLLPIVIIGDYLKFSAIVLGFSAPWLAKHLLDNFQANQHFAELMQDIPKPVLGILSALAVDWLFHFVKGYLINHYHCPVCGDWLRPTIRFCPNCGNRKSEPDSRGDTALI